MTSDTLSTLSCVCLLRCNVQTLRDLWWHGDQTRNIAPYRKLHTFDLTKADSRSHLSKAGRVMAAMEKIVTDEDATVILRKLGITESRLKFASAFDSLCASFSPLSPIEDIDRRRYGDSSYITFYDLIVRLKKRTLPEVNETA